MDGKLKNNHPQQQVSQISDVPASGDNLLLLKEAPTSKCPQIAEENTNLQQLRDKRDKTLHNIEDWKAKRFIFNKDKPWRTLSRILCLEGNDSEYADYYNIDETAKIKFRLGKHDANGANFSFGYDNLSVFISETYRSYRGIASYPYKEWEITPEDFYKDPWGIVNDIIDAMEKVLRKQQSFSLHHHSAKQVDTTKTDTVKDILFRYHGTDSSPIFYSFNKGQHLLTPYKVSLCTIEELQIEMKGSDGKEALIVSNGNKANIVTENGETIKITPDTSSKRKWNEFLHCLFKNAFNEDYQKKRQEYLSTEDYLRQWNRSIDKNISESKTNKNMKKKVINESQLRNIVAESIKRVLKEDYNEDPYYKLFVQYWNKYDDKVKSLMTALALDLKYNGMNEKECMANVAFTMKNPCGAVTYFNNIVNSKGALCESNYEFEHEADEMLRIGYKKLEKQENIQEILDWLNEHYYDLNPVQKQDFKQLWDFAK